MIIKYTKPTPDIVAEAKAFGLNVIKVSVGLLPTGEFIETVMGFDENEKPIVAQVPIQVESVHLGIDSPISISQLASLNKLLAGYKRDYKEVPFQEGEIRDLEKEVDALKAKVSALEAKSAK